MRHYSVRLQIRADRPLSAERIAGLQGGRHSVVALGKPRGRTLAVTLTMRASDAVGALIRAANVVLDQVPGEIRHAEITQSDGTTTKPSK